MSDVKEKIKRKIKALLAKTTENGATESEAINALKKAQILMLEYVISEQELKDPYSTEKCVLKEVNLIKSGYNLTLFYASLSNLFDCEHFYTRRKITFFGFEEDTELCAYFYNHIIKVCLSEKAMYLKSEEYRYASQYYHGKTLASSFIKGFLVSICRKMHDMYECRKGEVSNEVGLMIIQKNQKVQQQYEDMNLNIRHVKNRDLEYESEAFRSGLKKGSKISLTQGISQCKKESTLAIT